MSWPVTCVCLWKTLGTVSQNLQNTRILQYISEICILLGKYFSWEKLVEI